MVDYQDITLLAFYNAFLTVGPLIGLFCAFCWGQTSHAARERSTSLKVEDLLATLTWFGSSAKVVYQGTVAASVIATWSHG